MFDLKNTGQSEAVGSLRDFTYYVSINPEQREFAFQNSKAILFSLAPGEQWRGHFLPPFVLTAEKLEALDSGNARLFIYAKGEYRDSSGTAYSLPFARMYHPSVRAISPCLLKMLFSNSTCRSSAPNFSLSGRA